MEGMFSRETRAFREGTGRREGAHPSHALLSREQSRADLLRERGEPSNGKGHERAATSHNEIPSEATEQPSRIFDALLDKASFSRRGEPGNVWSPLHKEVVNKEIYENKDKNKLNQYQIELIKWNDKDVNSTLDAFQRNFETKIEENPQERGEFTVTSLAKEGSASYMNKININKGEIIGESNFKMRTRGWHLSEVIFNQLQLVMQKAKRDIVSFELKNWRGKGIINPSTRSAVELFLPAGTNKHTFEKDSPGFMALAGTPTSQSKFYMLAQHQKAFGKKEVTSITVERQSDGYICINYRYAQNMYDSTTHYEKE